MATNITDLFNQSGALFSEGLTHRYALWRIWDDKLPKVMYIGLNPSTADAEKDDPTITRLKGLTNMLGYGGFYMLNLFTNITPYPKQIDYTDNKSFKYLRMFANKASIIVFCWGNFEIAKNRAREVIKMFPESYCFGVNKDISPKHPLYLKSTTKLVKYPLSIKHK